VGTIHWLFLHTWVTTAAAALLPSLKTRDRFDEKKSLEKLNTSCNFSNMLVRVSKESCFG
jgi:hypothetical protein